MSMKHIIAIPALVLSAVLTSCVRDEVLPCPPLQVQITVKDKNYFNVDRVELEEKLPDNLPLRRYVPTLHYQLRRLLPEGASEIAVSQENFTVNSDAPHHTVTFDESLPHGTYVLTVWGGLPAEVKDVKDNKLSLHPQGAEGSDVYLSNDTLVYNYNSFYYTSELERTKGKLLIEACNLPQPINQEDHHVTGLFDQVQAHGFIYSGQTEINTSHAWLTEGNWVTKTLLSPSVKKDQSVLSMRFYEANAPHRPICVPPDLLITLRRNELTVLRYVYEDGGKFTIYMLVNDNWEEVHGMELD